MSLEDDNVAIVRKVYELWNKNREQAFETWLDAMADDIELGSLGAGAPGLDFTVTRRSNAEVREYLLGLAQDWEMIHYTPDSFIAQGDQVVMRGRCGWRHRRTGKTVETPKADFLRLRDGKIVAFYEFFDTAAALAATRP